MRKSLSTRRGQSLHHFAKIFLLPVLLFFWGNVWGQVSITTLPYVKSDDFNSYNPTTASTATSTISSGWSHSGLNYLGRSTGTGSGGAFYAYGISPDYSLGALRSGSNEYTYSINFTNNSGNTITKLEISWNYEQWRYSNTSGWNLTGTGQLISNTIVNAADFSGVATGTNGSLASTPKSIVLTGLNITNGQSFGFNFTTTDVAGSDNGVSIDDFSITASNTPAIVTPTITTTTATGVTATGANSGGNVTADGGATITARGLAYGTAINPTTGVSTTGTTGVFSSALSGLSVNTRYYYRAYASNSVGTSYGVESNFYTLANVPAAPVVDLPTETSLRVTVGSGDGNPLITEYAIQTGSQYVQANGALGATAVWQTAALWGSKVVTGLTPSTLYNFHIKARNGNSVETIFGSSASGTTLANEVVGFGNLQHPPSTNLLEGEISENIFAKAYKLGLTDQPPLIPAGLQVWIGVSPKDAPANSNPSTWTKWIPATWFSQEFNDDQYAAKINSATENLTPGTYRYASRFQINTGSYSYGGYNSGFWDGVTNVSGTLTVNSNTVGYANIQSPYTGTIVQGSGFDVYTRVFKDGFTQAAGANANITSWIGYSNTNATATTDFASTAWTWVPATFNVQVGNDDEYVANIGSSLVSGTYYYVSRYKVAGSTEYRYGGTNNNFWTAPANSGVLTVQSPKEINIKESSTPIASGGSYTFGNQAFGTSSSTRSFTVENTGQESLSVGTLSISGANAGEFIITQVSATLPQLLGGNSSTTFTVTFSPTSSGAKTAQLSLVNNDANENPYIINLTGNASPANDNCIGAFDLAINANPVTGDVAGAALSTGYNDYATANDDVWYKFSSSIATNFTVRVKGSANFDAVFEIRDNCGKVNFDFYRDSNLDGGEEVWTFAGAANTTYYVRVYDYFSGVPATTTFTVQVTADPVLATNGTTSLAFGNVFKGSNSTSQSFSLAGHYLTGLPAKITVNAPLHYEVSLDDTNWASSVILEDTNADAAITSLVYVRFNTSSACGATAGNITFTGGGVTAPPTIALTATAVVVAPIANSATDITATTFTANWNAVAGATGYKLDVYSKSIMTSSTPTILLNNSALGSQPAALPGWTFTNIATSTDYLKMVKATANNGIPTIISQAVDVTNYTTLKLNAQIATFASPSATQRTVTIYISTNDGATWTQVATRARSSNGSAYEAMGEVDLNSYVGYTQVRFKIEAISSDTSNGARLKEIVLSGIENVTTKTYVSDYNPKTITGGNITSHTVTGLTANTQYYYVVRAMTATCESANSNEVGVTTNNTIVWNGTAWSNNNEGPTAILNSKITGAYDISTSFETKDLEITSTGSLDIKADKDVIVNGNITLPADNKIVVESDASLVQKNTGADVNSNHSITVKRKALQPTKGYTFWSSPVSGQNLYNFSNGYNQALSGTPPGGTPWNRFFVYRESSDTFVTNITGEITLGTSSVFDQGRGYAIRGKNSYTPSGGTGEEIPAAADEFSFNGRMNNGPVFSQQLRNSCTAPEATCTKGYNMVGNPYPSNLDFDALYYANTAKIYGTAYFWTNNDITATAQQDGANYTGNNYAIYNLTGGTPAVEVDADPDQPVGANPIPNGVVKVGQGFIIKAKKLGAGTRVDFTNEMRVGYDADATFYNAKKAVKNRFWLKMTSPNKIANTVLIGYIPGATNGFEIDFDGELFIVGSDSFYSILGNKKLAIQGKANFGNEDIITVGTKYAVSGNYIISLGRKEGIFDTDQKIYLRDKLKNTYTDLASQDYTFFANKGLDESRFEIVYKNNEVLGAGTAKKSDFTVYRDGESFVIQSSEKLGKVQLFDVSGKLIFTTSTLQKELRLDATTISSGVYIIKAENSGNAKTKKIIR